MKKVLLVSVLILFINSLQSNALNRFATDLTRGALRTGFQKRLFSGAVFKNKSFFLTKSSGKVAALAVAGLGGSSAFVAYEKFNQREDLKSLRG